MDLCLEFRKKRGIISRNVFKQSRKTVRAQTNDFNFIRHFRWCREGCIDPEVSILK